MATAGVDVAKTSEYPDRVGAKPSNPYQAAFRPYTPDHVRLREPTVLPLVVGTQLGVVFGAPSLYLVGREVFLAGRRGSTESPSPADLKT